MSDYERQTTWQLANLADCGSPDTADGYGFGGDDPAATGSAGAQFLRAVEDDARELFDDLREDFDGEAEDWADYVEQNADYSGGVHEIADGAPDIYTHGRWAQFFDLAAYNEDMGDIGELTGSGADMTQAAGVALYLIAQRLVWALLSEWAEADAFSAIADR